MNKLLKLTMKKPIIEVDKRLVSKKIIRPQNYMRETTSSLNKKVDPQSLNASTNKTLVRKSSFSSTYTTNNSISRKNSFNNNLNSTINLNKPLSKKSSFTKCGYMDPYGHFNDIMNISDPYGHFK